MMNCDEIEVRRLEVNTHIGVPDEERASLQMIWVSLWMQPERGFDGINDDVSNTIDYAEVSEEVVKLGAEKPRKLIETMATDVADFLLKEYPLRAVTVKIEKKILPNADFVAVKVSRSA